jgi:hypothetical protein
VLCKVIGGEAVSKSVVQPFFELDRFPELRNNEVIVVAMFRPESSDMVPVRRKPRL